MKLLSILIINEEAEIGSTPTIDDILFIPDSPGVRIDNGRCVIWSSFPELVDKVIEYMQGGEYGFFRIFEQTDGFKETGDDIIEQISSLTDEVLIAGPLSSCILSPEEDCSNSKLLQPDIYKCIYEMPPIVPEDCIFPMGFVDRIVLIAGLSKRGKKFYDVLYDAILRGRSWVSIKESVNKEARTQLMKRRMNLEWLTQIANVRRDLLGPVGLENQFAFLSGIVIVNTVEFALQKSFWGGDAPKLGLETFLNVSWEAIYWKNNISTPEWALTSPWNHPFTNLGSN